MGKSYSKVQKSGNCADEYDEESYIKSASMAALPDELIAHICSFLSYSDICNLMLTNKKNYEAIKKYRMDKIKLQGLRIDTVLFKEDLLTLEARVSPFKSYYFKDWKKWQRKKKKKNITYDKGEVSYMIKKALDECSAINTLTISIDFTDELFRIVMAMTTDIRFLNVRSEEQLISAEDLLNLCEKYKCVTFDLGEQDPSIWNDEILTKILPFSTILKGYHRSYGCISPKLITDRTLEALAHTTEIQQRFDLDKIHSSITVKGIVGAMEAALARGSCVSWNFGTLQPDQADDAEHYFGKNGALRKNFNFYTEMLGSIENGIFIYRFNRIISAEIHFYVEFIVHSS